MTEAFNSTYEIKSMIGQGGMSTVYRAEQKRLHTYWAVKEVRKEQGAHFDFLAESNILKRLQHPTLPRIVDIFEDEDKILIVEDLVEGITLEEVLRRQKKVGEEQGLVWFKELCGVLGYLHDQQPNPIIYRDMKPSNIMLQPNGSLKLIDFGIAREYKQGSGGDTTHIGTEGYAAPEQFGSAQTDARTDIYALGVTMYHILTGKSPYEPPYQFVPACRLVPELSHGMEYILGRCVQPEPDARYQSIGELQNDLEHIYRFDKAWKHYIMARRIRIAVVAVLFVVSIGLMAGGQKVMALEKEQQFTDLLSQANELYRSDPDGAFDLLDAAKTLYPDRIEPDRQRTYALFLNGKWQECIDSAQRTLTTYGMDQQTRLTMASAQFELGQYRQAAEGFAQGEDLSVEHLRDYAVCLGRLGELSQAEQILESMAGKGARPDVTQYVQGEMYLAKQEYVLAEDAFLGVLEETEELSLLRRCYISLGDVYRDCTILTYTNASPIERPAERSIAILSKAVAKDGFGYDSVLWEMLGLAYFEAYHSEEQPPEEYLGQAAQCFERVIQLGVTNDYLYTNLYAIYYELQDFDSAEQALGSYEQMFPESYMPHALRGMLIITQENQKEQQNRDYTAALAEYELAGAMLRNTDDTTYYQQLGSLIDSLRQNGWLG